ncbi:hypothetical protein HanXRQr2_Chr07g0303461 [Helianthus annuus]|uniref:Uncharacterized protein n=1 Tax=Helianthus annuus TaxID=4232 RepID=A0A9K3NGA4_HELAN|nr:hypothetical protein HanXRQr2_Chr07g0303461 [Helianthus annuus]
MVSSFYNCVTRRPSDKNRSHQPRPLHHHQRSDFSNPSAFFYYSHLLFHLSSIEQNNPATAKSQPALLLLTSLFHFPTGNRRN